MENGMIFSTGNMVISWVDGDPQENLYKKTIVLENSARYPNDNFEYCYNCSIIIIDLKSNEVVYNNTDFHDTKES